MPLEVSFFFSIAILAAGIACAAGIRHWRKKFRNRILVLIAAIFLASWMLFLPVYLESFAGGGASVAKALLISANNAISVLRLNTNFSTIQNFIVGRDDALAGAYGVLAAVLYFVGPIIGLGFILSFFQNFVERQRVWLNGGRTMYVFSELNEKSVTLAESIVNDEYSDGQEDDPSMEKCTDKGNQTKEKQKSVKKEKMAIVFASVGDAEKNGSFAERAHEMGAIMLKEDVTAVRLQRRKKETRIFLLGDQYKDDIGQGIALVKAYWDKPQFYLYFFASGERSKVLMRDVESKESQGETNAPRKMKLRRIDIERSFAERMLYRDCDEGKGHLSLFELARTMESDGIKKIGVLILGMGDYGTNMVKALSWYLQMDGFESRIDAFDCRSGVRSSFAAECPELMSEEQNGKNIYGDAQYDIHIHDEIDVDGEEFRNFLEQRARDNQQNPITYIFIALGNDETSLREAMRTLHICEMNNVMARIQVVLHQDNLNSRLNKVYGSDRGTTDGSQKESRKADGSSNMKNQGGPEIEFLGGLSSLYSREIVFSDKLEDEARDLHLRWSQVGEKGNSQDENEKAKAKAEAEAEFYNVDYNYHSSIATVLHQKARAIVKRCFPDAIIDEDELEHKRWNAYMRSEGYVRGEGRKMVGRESAGKTHRDLVRYCELTPDERKKDEVIDKPGNSAGERGKD